MAKAREENSVQVAIQGALQVFCQERSLQLFPPYANQQGESLRKYCADVVGILEDGDLILLEVKQLDTRLNELVAFDALQHEMLQRMEVLGVPITYAYNRVHPLPYEEFPQPKGWPEKTLDAVNRAKPSELPDWQPEIKGHETLLDWLKRSRSHGAVALFGSVHGAVSSARELRNGVLVLLYSKARHQLATLSADEVRKVVSVLQTSPTLKERHQTFLRKVLGSSADVFAQFNAPPAGPKPLSPRARRGPRP